MSTESPPAGPSLRSSAGSPVRLRLAAAIATVLAVVAAAGLAIGACAQRDGERCQRSSDCAEGLTCNLGTQQCQAGVADGGVLGIDAPLDAEEPDAAPDASTDASIDASPQS